MAVISIKKIAFIIRRGAASLYLSYIKYRNCIIGKLNNKHRFYAEFFTDRYIRKNFFPDFSYQGRMVEVGCATPELLSMSKHFRDCGWRCIGIEPNPHFVALHRACNNEVYQYAAADFEADNYDFVVVEAGADYSEHQLSAHSYSSLSIKPEYAEYKRGALAYFNQSKIKVRVRRLDQIIENHCEGISKIDLLVIDVEGYEIEVMKGFSPERYKTKVIVMENLFHNNSYTEYMQSIGYKLHSKVKYNYIYVPDA